MMCWPLSSAPAGAVAKSILRARPPKVRLASSRVTFAPFCTARTAAAQPAQPAPAPAAPAMVADDAAQGEDLPDEAVAEESAAEPKGNGWLKNVGLVVLGAFLAAVIGMVVQRRLLLGR